MTPIRIEDEDALACPSRHGVWFDQGGLERVVDDEDDDQPTSAEDAAWSASDPEPDAIVTERFRTCPVCANTLRKDVFQYGSGIVVDTCDEHGTWVDAGEVEQIEAWAEAWERYAAAPSE